MTRVKNRHNGKRKMAYSELKLYSFEYPDVALIVAS